MSMLWSRQQNKSKTGSNSFTAPIRRAWRKSSNSSAKPADSCNYAKATGPPPRHLALPVISRVKVMANMNIAERRLPQDGRIQKNIAGRHIDLRVSTLPTQFGESVVLRVLDRSTVNLDLEMLGMPDYVHNYILEIIN